MSDQENSLTVKLSALGDTFQSGINNALGTWTDFVGQLGNGPASFAGIATAGVAAAGVLFSLAKSTANYGEELNKMSDQTGISVEDLSLLKFAAEQGDTSLQSLAAAVKFMQKNLVDAAGGNKDAERSFRALGLSIDDLKIMSTKDQLLAMADALKDVEDPAMRTKLALDIMGKGAMDMLPFMMQGKEGITAMMNEAEALGLKMSTETAKQADEFNDSLSKLWTVTKQIGFDIGAILLPPLRWLFDILSSLVGFLKGTFFATIHALNGFFLATVSLLLKVVEGATFLTDTLGMTSGAQKKVAEWQETINQMMLEAGKSTAESFTIALNAVTGTAHAQEGHNRTVKDHIKLTDEQRRAILAEKEAQEKQKKAADDAAKAQKAWLQASEQSVRDYLKSLDIILDYKKTTKKFDDEYFEAYSNKLRVQGMTEQQVAEMVTAEKKRLKDGELKHVITISDLEEEAVKGVAGAIKGLWNDTDQSFRDAWKRAADNFIDVILKSMVTQAGISAKAIQLEMAAASAGITLMVGMLAAAFSGKKGGGKSAIQQATEDFLREIRQTLKQFENEVLSTLQKLSGGKSGLSELLVGLQNLAAYVTTIQSAFPAPFVDAFDSALESMSKMKDLIMERYELEKGLIMDVIGLLSQQKGFIQDVDRAIASVTRSTFSEQDLLGAQKQDIANLLTMVSGSAGQERVDFARDLQSAYLAYFETAKGLFTPDQSKAQQLESDYEKQLAVLLEQGASNKEIERLRNESTQAIAAALDPSKLAAIQQEVIAGLEKTKAFGVSGYDQLIDINLEMLGVQRTGTDLQGQMVDLLGSVQAAVQSSLQILEQIGELGYGGLQADKYALGRLVDNLAAALQTLGINVPKMAIGGIVTKPTLAMIGERGAEAVIPLGRMAGMGGGGPQNFNFNISLNSLGDLTVAKAKELLRGAFGQAARELGKENVSWGMQPRSANTSY